MSKVRKKMSTMKESNRISQDLTLSSAKDTVLIENKHRQIVEGACRLFYTHGYHPTTIRQIAEACGMSMGQLYHYISCKDDVLYLVHRHFHRIWFEYVKAGEAEQSDDPVERFVSGLRRNLAFVYENRELMQFIYSETKYLDDKHLRVVLEMDKKNVLGYFRQRLEDLNTKIPVNTDLDILASILAFVGAFQPLRGWTVRDKPEEKITECLLQFILRGVGVPAPQ
jgi:AcrR family transcriptional regulator